MKYLKKHDQVKESLDFKKSRSRIFIRKYMDEFDITSTKDYWYILSEMGYREWNREGTEVKGLGDMMEFTKEKYGELAEFAILLKNYIGQVNNGGHMQYYDNGYAGSGGGFSNHGDDMENHDRMTELFQELEDDFDDSQWYSELLNIMESFDIELDDERYEEVSCEECSYGELECEECYGSGSMEDDEGEEEDCGSCDGQGRSECGHCDGSGNTEIDNEEYEQPTYGTKEKWDKLDDRLYALDKKVDFEKVFNEYFKKIIES